MGPEERQTRSSRVPRYGRGSAPSSQPEYDLYYMRLHRVWHPPTDVYETDDGVVVKVEIAGMDDEGLDISFANRQLTIRGNRHDRIGCAQEIQDAGAQDAAAHGAGAQETGTQGPDAGNAGAEKAASQAEGKVTYHNMEIHYGEFLSQVRINLPVDEGAIEARYEDGFLYVILPKPREHRIQVSVQREDHESSL